MLPRPLLAVALVIAAGNAHSYPIDYSAQGRSAPSSTVEVD